MKTPDSMLDNCLCWLTETSMFRYRLNGLRGQLQRLSTLFAGDEAGWKKYTAVMHSIQNAANELHLTESKLLYTTKQHAKTISCDIDEDTRYLLQNEEELYENMKYFYILFIELQKSINHLIKEKPAQIATTKVIQLRHVQRQNTAFAPYAVLNSNNAR